MTAPATLTGVMPVVQTPFTADGAIDVVAVRDEVAWAASQGVSGIATGMVSELLRLSDTERRTLSEAMVATAAQHALTSVISCGAESTRVAVEHAQHAEQIGADAIMVNGPVTVTLSSPELHRHFSAILEETVGAVVIQDASGYVGQPLDLELQARLLDEYGDRVYFKPEASPTGPRLSQLRDLTGGAARVIEGTGGGVLIDSFRRGVVGTMPGTEVCWAVQRLWTALGTGEWPLAYAISGTLNAMLAVQTTIETYVAVEKHLLVRQGVLPAGHAREPGAVALDAETVAEIDRLFDQLRSTVDASRPERPAGGVG